MNRNLIDYTEFCKSIETLQQGGMGFEELLHHLEENTLHLTKSEYIAVTKKIIEKINYYNDIEIKNTFGNDDIKLYTFDIDPLDDVDYQIFTIQISYDFSIKQYINIETLIRYDNTYNTDDFLKNYGELAIGKINLKQFLQLADNDKYELSKKFQEKFIKNLDDIIENYSKDNDTTFAYKAALDFNVKVITFYELKDNKVLRSYSFKWTI
jgi:hypothetical protein